MKSVLQTEKECFVCGTTYNVQDHHIFFGKPNRQLSEKRGLKVFLCVHHHTGSNEAVHNNRVLDLSLKRMAQKYYEEHYGTREDFIAEFGRNYIED